MAAKMRENVPEKTGKKLADWFTVLEGAGLEKHGEMMKLLKNDHGVGHGFANLIVHDFRSRGAEPIDPVADQYAGKKEHLRPIYEAIMSEVEKLGGDVEVSPKKAYVSLRRSKQFATVGPATASAVEVGLNMKGHPVTDRLLAGKGMVTHRVRLGSAAEVDAQLVGWIRTAYEGA
jgi:predicted transport protein